MAERRPEDDAYLVAGCKPWNRRAFDEILRHYPGRWDYVGARRELTPEVLARLRPRYVFFLHWSWLVPPEVFENYECICFHMTDVPFGRGGSPLQNLVARGHRSTQLTALRMVRELDAGPVYAKEALSLDGTAEEVYVRATRLATRLIRRIVADRPDPVPQTGAPVVFPRRRPEESALPVLPALDAVHDFIRMLDADGYPRAFLVHAGYRFEFSRASLYDGRVRADVCITPLEDGRP